jgi:hypothetical protein
VKDVEHFKNGKFHGEYTTYYKNGQIKEKGNFKNDRRDGDYIAYHRDGYTKERAAYVNGRRIRGFQPSQGDAQTRGIYDEEDEKASSSADYDLDDNAKKIDDLLKGLREFAKEQEEDR